MWLHPALVRHILDCAAAKHCTLVFPDPVLLPIVSAFGFVVTSCLELVSVAVFILEQQSSSRSLAQFPFNLFFSGLLPSLDGVLLACPEQISLNKQMWFSSLGFLTEPTDAVTWLCLPGSGMDSLATMHLGLRISFCHGSFWRQKNQKQNHPRPNTWKSEGQTGQSFWFHFSCSLLCACSVKQSSEFDTVVSPDHSVEHVFYSHVVLSSGSFRSRMFLEYAAWRTWPCQSANRMVCVLLTVVSCCRCVQRLRGLDQGLYPEDRHGDCGGFHDGILVFDHVGDLEPPLTCQLFYAPLKFNFRCKDKPQHVMHVATQKAQCASESVEAAVPWGRLHSPWQIQVAGWNVSKGWCNLCYSAVIARSGRFMRSWWICSCGFSEVSEQLQTNRMCPENRSFLYPSDPFCTYFFKSLPSDTCTKAVPDRADAVLRIAPEGAHLVGGPLIGHFKWYLGRLCVSVRKPDIWIYLIYAI